MTVSQLAEATRHATQLEANIREQAKQAAEQATRLQNQTLELVQNVSANAVEKALLELSKVEQQTTGLQSSLRAQAREASEELARLQQAAIEKVHTSSAGLVQEALSQLSEAEQRALGLQSSLREHARQASEQAARVQREALEKVQTASTDAVQKTLAQLSQAEEQAVLVQNSLAQKAQQISEQAREAAEQTVQQSIAHLREEAAKYPAEVDQSCRAVFTKTRRRAGTKELRGPTRYLRRAAKIVRVVSEKGANHDAVDAREGGRAIDGNVARPRC